MNQQLAKQRAAQAALNFIEDDMIVGVGTGSTVDFFIQALAKIKNRIEAAVASSVKTEQLLKAAGIPVLDLNSVQELPIYIDGADEVNSHKQMIKGGGGAATREKILASMAKKFICVVDSSKQVDILGQHPVAIEVLPLARSWVARQIVKLGADPVYRENVITDNGNQILDVYNLKLLDPLQWENKFKTMLGVVDSGIFANRTADIVLAANEQEVIRF